MADVDMRTVDAAEVLVRQAGIGSRSMLQRKLSLLWIEAERVLDALEQRGVVGPVKLFDRPRDVLAIPPAVYGEPTNPKTEA